MPSLLTVLGLNSSQFNAGLDAAAEKAAAAGKSIASELGGQVAGFLSAAAIEETIRRTVEYGGHVVDLSHKLGMSTDAVQVWDFALRRNNSTIDQAAGFFEKLATARNKIARGDADSKKLIDDFKQLGVSVDDLRNKRIEDIAEQIGDLFHAGGDPQELIGALREVGGRGAGEMIAAMRDGIRQYKKELEDAGLIISHEVVLRLKEASDLQEQMGAEVRSWTAGWIADMAEGLKFLIDMIHLTGSAFVAMFKNALHPGKIGDAVYGSVMKNWEAMVAQDKERKAKEERDEAESSRLAGAGGADIDEEVKVTAKVLELRKELDELTFNNELRHLSTAEQLLELEKKKAALAKEAAEAQTEEDKLQAEIAMARITAQMAAIEKSEHRLHSAVARNDLNAHQRIGAFSADPIHGVAGQQLTAQKEGNHELKEHTKLLMAIKDRLATSGQRPHDADTHFN